MFSSDDGGGLFGLTLVSASFSNIRAVTMVGDASLVSLGRDAMMFAGSSAGGSGSASYLASRSTIGGSSSLFGGRGYQTEEEVLVFHQLFVVPPTWDQVKCRVRILLALACKLCDTTPRQRRTYAAVDILSPRNVADPGYAYIRSPF